MLINMHLMTYRLYFVSDLSLFDELDNLGDVDDLFVALEKGSYVSNSSFEYAEESCAWCTKLNVSDRSYKKNCATAAISLLKVYKQVHR